TLNPGAINRNVRGFPDDWKGEDVIYHNKVPDNVTIALSGGFSIEAFSFGGSFNGSMRLNSYTGFGTSQSFGVSFGGVVSLGYHYSDGDGSFSLSVNPAAALKSLAKKAGKAKNDAAADADAADKSKDSGAKAKAKKEYDKQAAAQKMASKGYGAGNISLLGGSGGIFTYDNANRPGR